MDQYRVLDLVGKGSFGVVRKIQRRSDGRILVWKELNYGSMSDKEKQLVVSEVNILRELRHPHILRYYDRIIDKPTTKLFVITEYCEGGDLGKLIKRYRAKAGKIDEQRIWKYFAQIIMALSACHRRKEKGVLKPILHRDIKPANVFLDRYGNVKMGDFGLARELDSQSKFARTNVGTPYYMSPEQTNGLKYDERSDIWAVGCVLYELAALRPPFQARNQVALAMKINAGKFDRIPMSYSDDLHRAIRWMLHINLKNRPRVEECQSIPQVKAYYASQQQKMQTAAAGSNKLGQKGNTVKSTSSKEVSAALAAREKKVAEKEMNVTRRERKLNENIEKFKNEEKLLKEKESTLKRMEQKLLRLQTDLTLRETRLETAEMELRLKQRTVSASVKAPSALNTGEIYSSMDSYKSTAGKINLDGAKWAKAAKPFENKTNTLGYQGFTIDSKLSKESTKLTEL